MLTDPQTVTVATVAQSLAAISRGPQKSIYRKDSGAYTLTVSHTEGKRDRRLIRLDHLVTASDPLNASVNVEQTLSIYFVIDSPPWGFTNTQRGDDIAGLVAWMSPAAVLKVLGGES